MIIHTNIHTKLVIIATKEYKEERFKEIENKFWSRRKTVTNNKLLFMYK